MQLGLHTELLDNIYLQWHKDRLGLAVSQQTMFTAL